MKIRLEIIIALSIILLSVSCKNGHSSKEEEKIEKFKWNAYRGVNVSCSIQEEDVKHLAASGGNFMRLSMPICTFMEMEEPYAYREEAFTKVKAVLDWGEKYGVAVLLDPHRYPGTQHMWTMLGDDPFFQEFKWHDIFIGFWEKLALQCADRKEVLAGYDLLNEPQVDIDMKKGTPADINLLYKKATAAIRKIDSVHTIVYALPRVYDRERDIMHGYHKGIALLDIPDDDNICLETHTYMPVPFTHQNIWEEGDYVAYPVTIDSVTWNKEQLQKEQSELLEFSKKNSDIPILVGEFSSPRWTGEDGMRYLTDVIDIAEENNWSWSYHAYRENQVWDPEMSITDRQDSIRRSNAPRWALLKDYFKQNK